MKDYGNEVAEFIYYTPGKWDREGQFWPVRAGMSTAKPGYSVGPKRIECYSMHFVRKGTIQFEYEGKQKILEAGDVFCLYPEQTYMYRKIDQKSSLQLSWLAVAGPRMETILKGIGFSQEEPFIEKRELKSIIEVFNLIFERMKKKASSEMKSSFELQGLLFQLFSMLIRDEKLVHPIEQMDWIHRSVEYIDLHATEGISVQQIAGIIGVNRTYFSTEFSKQVGISPIKYITKVRMTKAREMLKGTTASITEISYSLGYPTLFAFTRAFKKYFLLSPTGYRNQ